MNANASQRRAQKPHDADRQRATLEQIEQAVRAVTGIRDDEDLFKPTKYARDRRSKARDLAVFVAFECGFGSRQMAELTGIPQSYVSGIARRFARKLRSQPECKEALRGVERELKSRASGARVA